MDMNSYFIMNRNIYSVILLQYLLFLVINGMFGYGWNRRERSGEKLILWFFFFFFERSEGRKISRAQVFSSLTHQNSIFLIWVENKGEKNSCSQWLNYSSFFHLNLLLLFHIFFFFLGCGPSCFFTSFFGHDTNYVLFILFSFFFCFFFVFCLTIHEFFLSFIL